MTPVEIAAHQAADREVQGAYLFRERHETYVRAFLAGARWHQQQIRDLVLNRQQVTHTPPGAMITHNGFSPECPFCQEAVTKIMRAGTADQDTSPATGSIASPDTAKSELRGKSTHPRCYNCKLTAPRPDDEKWLCPRCSETYVFTPQGGMASRKATQ